MKFIKFFFALIGSLSFGQTFEPLDSKELALILNQKDSLIHVVQTSDDNGLIILKNQSKYINPFDSITSILGQRMLTAVTNPKHDGVGIAAPQVGINRRMFWAQRFDKPENPFELFINPIIVNESNTYILGPEGDLSFEERGLVYRNEWIDVVYYNEKGELLSERLTGFTAVIFQHERDHLDGILLTDRILEQQKRKFSKIEGSDNLYTIDN